MKRIINTLASLAIVLAGLIGCTPEFETPAITEDKYEGTETTPIKDFKETYKNTTLEEIKGDVVLHGIVNASDSSGNIYKKIYFQDVNGTAGLEISVDATANFNLYNVGQEIFVKCKGLYIGKYGGVLQLGTPYKDKYGNTVIGRMPKFYAYQHIFCNGKRNKSSVKVQTINSLGELTNDMLDRVITINNVFFPAGDKEVFANKPTPTNTMPTPRDIADLKGNKSIVYTSGYANFAQDKLPKGLGSITCIASQYKGAWQLIIRDRNDIGKFDGSDIDPNISVIVESLNEAFSTGNPESVASNNGWSVFSSKGDRNWIIKEYKSEKYAQASAYKGTAEDYEYWLVTPGLNLDKASQKLVSFETAMAFWMSTSSLEVYLMNDKDPDKATTKELLNVRTATETDGENTWIPTGPIDLSSKSGVVYLAFRYRAKGGLSNSTTFRLDNFKFGSEVK